MLWCHFTGADILQTCRQHDNWKSEKNSYNRLFINPARMQGRVKIVKVASWLVLYLLKCKAMSLSACWCYWWSVGVLPCWYCCQVRDDPERTVVHPDDDQAVVTVETCLYQRLADHLHLPRQPAVAPAAPLPRHDVPRLHGGHLGVGLGDLEQFDVISCWTLMKTICRVFHVISAVPASWPMHGSTHEFIKAQCHSHDNRDTLWSTHNNTHDHLVQQWRHWQRILCSQTLLLPPQHHRQVPDGGGEVRGGQHLVWSIVLLLSVDETGRILVQRWHQLAQATALLKYREKILNDWEWVVCTLKLNIIFKLQLDTLTRYWIGKTIRLRLFYCTMKQFSGPWPRRQSSVCRSALVVMIDTNNVGSLSCCHVWGRARTPN